MPRAKNTATSAEMAGSERTGDIIEVHLTPVIRKFPDRNSDGVSAQQFRRQRHALLCQFSNLEQTALLEPDTVMSELVLLRLCFKDDPWGLWGHALKSLLWLGTNMRLRNGAHATWKDLGDIANSVTEFLDVWIATPPTKQTAHRFILNLQHQKMLLAAGIEVEQAALRYTCPQQQYGSQPEK